MIDSHCHLTDPRLSAQLDTVLGRAAAAGVRACVTIGTGPADSEAAVALCRDRRRDQAVDVRCAVGVHPTYCADVSPDDAARVADLTADPVVVAVGEIGLDYFHESGDAARLHQSAAFAAQLAAADRLKKPVVVHCRLAVADTLAVMADFPSVSAVFHCFTGTPAEAERVLARGYLIGLTGVVTFKKSDDLRRVAAAVPDDRLLVETDAPYLSPEPVRRQKVCEPAFVAHTLRAVAASRGASADALDATTTANAERFFGLVP